MVNRGANIFIIVGASGSGKTSIGMGLKTRGIVELISHTTRPIREGEIEDVTYYYVSKKEIDEVEKVEFMTYGGNDYCLSKQEVDTKLHSGSNVFIIAARDGAMQIKEMYPEAKIVFVKISLDQIETRMASRGDAREVIDQRIKNAADSGECEVWEESDIVIENNDGMLEKSIEDIYKYIMSEDDIAKQFQRLDNVYDYLYYDRPIISLLKDPVNGDHFIAQLTEDCFYNWEEKFLLYKISPEMVKDIEEEKISYIDVIKNSLEIFSVDYEFIDNETEMVATYKRIKFEDINDGDLPEGDVKLIG